MTATATEINWRTPLEAFAPLAGVPHAHLFHGGELAQAPWSVIVAFPVEMIESHGDGAQLLSAIKAHLADREKRAPAPWPFSSGLAGFLGYEALHGLEPTLIAPPSPEALPDAAFGVYDAAALFSRREKRAFIVGRCDNARRRLKGALGAAPISAPAGPLRARLSSNFTRRAYRAAVSHIVERIREGEFYQANISQRIVAKTAAPFAPFDLFRLIAKTSDARFGALLQYEKGAIVSNSPERFFEISLDKDGSRRITTEPIKGTRRRAGDPKEDAARARELLNDPKDRAENIMIADLMRNDLSKICRDGSIREDAICELARLRHVHHLVSRISGLLREDVTAVDALRALFPSGSVTGAPKVAAMNAIASVEGCGRGPYCGAVGVIDDSGRADFSVAIRTLSADPSRRRVTIPVGGGVTLRSDPQSEYDETLDKAAHAAGAFPDLERAPS
jgi:para-aminobenzoate synthetase component 1